MKDERSRSDANKRDKIIAKQCPTCRSWFSTRLPSRVRCVRCEANERQEGQCHAGGG